MGHRAPDAENRLTRHSFNLRLVAAALVTCTIILGASLAYVYVGAQAEIANLNKDNANLRSNAYSICIALSNNYSSSAQVLLSSLANSTSTLNRDIAADQALIATLNATKPAGYQDMINSLQSQVYADNMSVNSIWSLILGFNEGVTPGGPCSAFLP
jgi:hypothetical protein